MISDYGLRLAVLVFVDSYYAVFDIRFFTDILLRLPQDALVHLRNHFPISMIGFYGAISAFMSAVATYPAGLLSDRLGRGHA